jgi:hypothetical protein
MIMTLGRMTHSRKTLIGQALNRATISRITISLDELLMAASRMTISITTLSRMMLGKITIHNSENSIYQNAT